MARALRALVADGGTVVYGEGYWRAPPSPAFLAALGGATKDELDTLGGLRTSVLDAGFAVASLAAAGEADWAAYEERTLGFALLVLRAPGRRSGGG